MAIIKLQEESKYNTQERINEFLELQRDKGVSVMTLKQHIYALRALHKTPNKLPDIVDLRRCLSPTRGNATFNKRLCTYRQFYKYLIEFGHTENDPTKNFKYRKMTMCVTNIPQEDVTKLLEKIPRKTFSGYRDYVITILILSTGIRPSEVMQLTLNDINFTMKEINLPATITKTRQARTVPVSPMVLNCIRKLVSYKPKEWGETNLFCTSEGTPLTTARYRDRLKETCYKAGVNIQPYDLRHIFATTFIRNGGDVFSLQRILGHTTPRMTMVYVNLDLTDIHRRYEQVCVLNSFLPNKKVILKTANHT